MDRRDFPGEDRLSNLPEVLRLHILSFLPRGAAIRSGTLSTKWKDLWKKRFIHETMLSFGKPYVNNESQNEIAKEIEMQMTQHGNKKIVKFGLFFHPGNEHREITQVWLEQAVLNGVEEFYLDFSQGILGLHPSGRLASRTKKFELRENVFKLNQTLTVLCLSYCRLQRNFSFRFLGSLEILHLQGLNINDRTLEKVIENCRQLQTLELRECISLKHVKISSRHTRLKTLNIVHCWNTKEIDVSSPMLQTFHFFGKFPSLFLFGEMPSLSDVIIITAMKEYLPFPHDWSFIFMRLDQVQVLTICSASLQRIYGTGHSVYVTFGNLRELQLRMETVNNVDLTYAFRFFRHCRFPLLQSLFIEFPPALTNPLFKLFLEPAMEDPPHLLFEHLKTLKLNNFKGDLNEMVVLEYFLRRSVNLEIYVLVFPEEYSIVTSDHEKASLYKEISQIQRASQAAKLLITYTSEDNQRYRPVHADVLPRFYDRLQQVEYRTSTV